MSLAWTVFTMSCQSLCFYFSHLCPAVAVVFLNWQSGYLLKYGTSSHQEVWLGRELVFLERRPFQYWGLMNSWTIAFSYLSFQTANFSSSEGTLMLLTALNICIVFHIPVKWVLVPDCSNFPKIHTLKI